MHALITSHILAVAGVPILGTSLLEFGVLFPVILPIRVTDANVDPAVLGTL
jgi:hypothetical protein